MLNREGSSESISATLFQEAGSELQACGSGGALLRRLRPGSRVSGTGSVVGAALGAAAARERGWKSMLRGQGGVGGQAAARQFQKMSQTPLRYRALQVERMPRISPATTCMHSDTSY